MPTNRPSLSTTGRAVNPFTHNNSAASLTPVEVVTVTTGWDITSRAFMFSLLRFDDPDALSPDAGRSTSQCEGASIGSTVVHTNQTA
jgi:hypothetical protein